ncbi:hypothetical protein WJX82_006033 [Trebouxia sp. C0006]
MASSSMRSQVGRTLQATLAEGNKQKCGYAAVADVSTGLAASQRQFSGRQ